MNYFQPSASRARELRAAMDKSLWDSARELLDEAQEGPPAVGAGSSTASVSGATSLLDYAAYFDLDYGLRNGLPASDPIRRQSAVHLRQRLAAVVPLEPSAAAPRVSNFDTAHYTPDELEQLSRWWDTEPANRMDLTAASAEEYARARRGIEQAVDYLRRAAPELHAEIELVIRDIVLSRSGPSNAMNYAGASSFALWGAITLNAETQCDWTQLYRQLVHETGHNLLFAIAREEPLVKAHPSVRRPSPLRSDARPLDGIFHAAYVSAREAAGFESLLEWNETVGGLSQDDVDLISDTLHLSVRAFWECVETVRNDDDGVTELGAAVLADCETFMREHFAFEPIEA